MEPQRDGGTKVCSNGPAHMTKMATMTIYGKKNEKLSFFWNQKADDLESWYEAKFHMESPWDGGNTMPI